MILLSFSEKVGCDILKKNNFAFCKERKKIYIFCIHCYCVDTSLDMIFLKKHKLGFCKEKSSDIKFFVFVFNVTVSKVLSLTY